MKISGKMVYTKYLHCILFALLANFVLGFDYNDLKNISGSCHGFGSCEIGKSNRLDLTLDWKDDNCFCDNKCIEYGDCCLGAKAIDLDLMKVVYKNFECVNTEPYGSYYMKGKCSRDWTSADVSELCQKASPESSTFQGDPFLNIPVTSLKTDITYKNYYCAICNNEDAESVEVWNAQLSCPEIINQDKESIREKLQYINGSWGIFLNNSERNEDSFMICDVLPIAKETVLHKIRRCKNFISTCSSRWTDPDVEELCQSYTTLVYGPPPEPLPNITTEESLFDFQFQSSTPYRNYHCAMCNFINVTDLTCYERNFRQAPSFAPVSFSTLFDFGVKHSICSDGQIWDPFTKKCWQVVCSDKNSEFQGGRCVKRFDTIISTTPEANALFEENQTEANSTAEKSKMKCDKLFINETDFTREENGTIKVTIFRRTYEESEYEIYKEGILVCIPDTYSRLMGWLTLIGLGLSCACLIAHLITFLVVPDLRNLSGKNLASLCIALLIAYLCFLITSLKENGTDSCPILASIMYYFFLASFFWMNVMAFDIWRTLQMATSELRLTTGRQWKKFLAYSFYAWLLPLISLIIVLAIDYYKPSWIPHSFVPELGKRLCWFGQRKSILVYFAAPLAAIMILNIVFFLMAVKLVAPSARSNTVSCTQSNQVQLKLYLRLALLMGLSWISGIIAGYIQVEYIWYIFILLNAFQGLFILIAFTCTKKVIKALKDKNSLKNSRSQNKNSLSRQVLESQDSNHSHLSNTSSSNLSTVTTVTSKSSMTVHSP